MDNQLILRAQKSFALINGSPSYSPVEGFVSPVVHTRTTKYSANGQFFAYALPESVLIFTAEDGKLLRAIQAPNVVEIAFSPKGTFLMTWERYSKPADENAQHTNLKVFAVATGLETLAFTQKGQENWAPLLPPSEAYLIRQSASGEIHVYNTSDLSAGPRQRLKIEGVKGIFVGGGVAGDGIAVWVGERKGAPGTLSLYPLNNLSVNQPAASKTFYKGDKLQLKWNDEGSMALFCTQTDVDATNKSYYGETNLYLMALKGGFQCRVALDKEGPVHDFNWSPNSKEFGVVYGYMPAKTVIFNTKGDLAHDLGLSPRNFISFQPQSRLFLVAGFGNLSGSIDVWDRSSLKKVTEIRAPNASHCEWSPCGRFILTATLSPRLRVDNGLKIWWCSGGLQYVELINELYQASWRPRPLNLCPPFPATIPSPPAPSESVAKHQPIAAPAPVAMGAYRPPGARGASTPMLYKREDEGGAPSGPPSPSPYANGGRTVPGAPRTPRNGIPPGAADPHSQNGKKTAKNGKKGGRRENGAESHEVEATPPQVEADPPAPPIVEAVDPIAKKVRNLVKKLKAIEDLKDKKAKGEKLEATQESKIANEAEIKKELAALESGR